MDYYYHKPEFEIESQRISDGIYPLYQLGNLCNQITDGTHYTPKYVDEAEGKIKFLSVKDVREFQILFEDVKYISEEEHLTFSKRCNPQPGDILLTKIGTTGLSAVIPDNAPTFDIFVSVCLIKPKKEIINTYFLSTVLNSPIARLQFARDLKGVGVPDLHLENIAETLIPLPPPEIQRSLVAEIEAARQTRKQKLVQADELLSSLDAYLLDQLGLAPPRESDHSTFAISLGEARTRFDVDYHTLRFRNLRRMIESNSHSVMSVMDVCKKPLMSGFAAGRQEQALDDVEGIPHIRPLNITPFGDLSFKGTKYVPLTTISENELLVKDEVLFNNTNSMEWVGKSTVFDGSRESACSNHITRLLLKKEIANSFFIASLFNALRSLGFMGLLSTNFNNQAGINNETLSMLRIPIPSLDEQRLIVSEMSGRRANAQRLRQEAETEWETAKARFECKLLGEEW